MRKMSGDTGNATGAVPPKHGLASDRLLVAAQVADRWQVPKSHVYRLSREGVLPTVAIGRYRRFRLSDLERFEAAGGVSQL